MTKDNEKKEVISPEKQDKKSRNKLPIDRGWAWVIVLATFSINLIQIGMYRSFGILFVEFLDEFKAPTSVTSLVMGMYSAAYSLTALVGLNFLLERFSIRFTCLLGGILMSLGGILSYFAMNLEYLIFTQSILPGALRDITGTYYASFNLLGSTAIASALFLLAEPFTKRWMDARKVKAKEEELKALNNVTGDEVI